MKKRPFVLMADWNIEPAEISAEWLNYIEAEVARPQGVALTRQARVG